MLLFGRCVSKVREPFIHRMHDLHAALLRSAFMILIEYTNAAFVSLYVLRLQGLLHNHIAHRREEQCDPADNVIQGRLRHIEAESFETLVLTIQRQVIQVFVRDDMTLECGRCVSFVNASVRQIADENIDASVSIDAFIFFRSKTTTSICGGI